MTYFRNNEMCFLQSDKEGSFVALEKCVFNEKADKEIEKSVTLAKLKPSKAKSGFVNLCTSLELAKFARHVAKCKSDALRVFFAAKTGKMDLPFRAIVSERGTGQLNANHYLLKVLNSLQVTEPFLTKKSDEVADFFESNH